MVVVVQRQRGRGRGAAVGRVRAERVRAAPGRGRGRAAQLARAARARRGPAAGGAGLLLENETSLHHCVNIFLASCRNLIPETRFNVFPRS